MEAGSSGILSRDEWTSAVKKRLGDTAQFHVLSVDWGLNSDEMVGFLGEHFRVKVSVLVNGQDQQVLHFFVKTIPKGSSFHSKLIRNSGVFSKEVGLFSIIFEQFEKYGLVPSRSSGLQWAPECYFTRPDILVFDNLAAQGFEMANKFEYMETDHIRLVLSALARFHAAGIAYEELETRKLGKDCKLNQLYPDLLRESLFIASGEMRECVLAGNRSLLVLLKETEKYGLNSELYESISDVFMAKCDKMFEYVKPSDKYRNVINHGDMWPNNIMFRYGADGKTPEECRLVDYQMIRYAPAGLCVMVMICIVTNREFRRKHSEGLLRDYYKVLEGELQRHGVAVFSWQEFYDSCKYYFPAALINAACYLASILIPEAILVDYMKGDDQMEKFMLVDRNEAVLRCFKEIPQYRERLTDYLETLVECVILEVASD